MLLEPRTIWGPWPSPPPPERGALWLDGGLPSAVLASWAQGRDWMALISSPSGAALATAYGTEAIAIEGAPDEPGAIAAGARVAKENGAAWLALPLAHHHQRAETPLAIKLTELETALEAWGYPSLVAPFIRCSWPELGRLGTAYGVPWELVIGCVAGCGHCEACKGLGRARVAAGRSG